MQAHQAKQTYQPITITCENGTYLSVPQEVVPIRGLEGFRFVLWHSHIVKHRG